MTHIGLLTKFGITDKEREKRQAEREAELQVERERPELKDQRGKAELQFEAKMREIEHSSVMELEQLRHYSITEDSKTHVLSSLKVKVPKLPNFEKKNDNMDSNVVFAFLKGKALDVYSQLPRDDASNYDLLKTALLERFEVTEEGF
ncbi:hypothetical protein DPMN_035195 [Dreissena polymorpha]|uniref:Uncharacterized protein n=1 Tax=Dreissena polymorpha TaxID=45954 RepID=A0A9D4RMR3_DREPO|nr:hypothetical protein DPMN_035195 [Dreissena polymorpha]